MTTRGGMSRLGAGLVVVALVVACRAPEATPTPQTGVRIDAPAPPSAVIDVGAGAVDAGRAFVAYRVELDPKATARRYEAVLVKAGYAPSGRREGWSVYARGKDVLLVRVGNVGPPTTVLVQQGDMSDVRTADRSADPGGLAPTSDLGTPEPPSGVAVSSPAGPAHQPPSATATTGAGTASAGGNPGNPGNPGNGSGSGSGAASGAGNGGGHGAGTPATGGGNGSGQGGGIGSGSGQGQGNGQGQGQGTGHGNAAPTPEPAAGGGPTPSPTPKDKGNGNGNGKP